MDTPPPTTGSFRLTAVLGSDGPPIEAAIFTLLNSDLVGSTGLVERLGDRRASEVFERHDRLARDLLIAFGGLEIDRTDGFLMLFERPVEAVAFALRYHLELDKLGAELGVPLAARVGIHLGEVVIKRNSPEDVARGAKRVEVEGLAKPIVTRLGNLAVGGQTLLTQSAYELARRAAVSAEQLPDEIAWVDHGSYRLAGVGDAVVVHEVGRRGSAPLAPPPSSAKAQRVSERPIARRLALTLVAILAVGALIVALTGGWWSGEGEAGAAAEGGEEQSTSADLLPKRVMVMPFVNRTGDEELDSLGVIVADWLAQGLSRGGRLEIVPLDLAVRSTRFVAEQSDDEERPDLFVVAEETGAGTVVSGAYYKSGDELVLRGQITDAAGRKMISPIDSLRTPDNDPIGVLEELEQAVRIGVAAHLDPQLAQFGNLVTKPPSYEAYEAYVEGMEHYWRLDFGAAIASFERAAELAPDFPTPQLSAASAHINLGRCDRVEEIVDRLEPLRSELAPQDRFYIDWLRARCGGDRARSVQLARRAMELSPQSSWAQTLGVDALQANRPRLAAEVLAPLPVERGYLRGWTPHFFYLTCAWHHMGDHQRELEDARRGRRLYPMSLQVLMTEARALAALGREEELSVLLEEATELQREFLTTPGGVITLAALELEAHGRAAAGERAAQKAVDWYSALPAAEASDPLHRDGLARALFAAKRYREAEETFAALAAEQPAAVDYLGFLGVLRAQRGDRSAAELADRLAVLDRPYLFGKEHYWQAAILAWQRQPEAALGELRRAVAGGHPFEWPELHPHVDPVWRPLRDDPAFLDFIEPRG